MIKKNIKIVNTGPVLTDFPFYLRLQEALERANVANGLVPHLAHSWSVNVCLPFSPPLPTPLLTHPPTVSLVLAVALSVSSPFIQV